MNKEFIPYEQSVALKELGFDEPCMGYYIELKNPIEGLLKIGLDNEYLQAPLYQQVFRWFREKYEFYHTIDTYFNEDNTLNEHCWYVYQNSDDRMKHQLKMLNSSEIHQVELTYEEAENACIDKLISIAKQ